MDEKRLEACKVRIEEFDRNYLSLREVEWKVAIESLTGYAAVAAAHYQLRNQFAGSLLTTAGVLLPILLFAVYLFLSWNIQRRLRYNRETRNKYIKKMHEITNLEEFEKNTPPLPFQHHYAFVSQLAIQVIVVVSVVSYAIIAAVKNA